MEQKKDEKNMTAKGQQQGGRKRCKECGRYLSNDVAALRKRLAETEAVLDKRQTSLAKAMLKIGYLMETIGELETALRNCREAEKGQADELQQAYDERLAEVHRLNSTLTEQNVALLRQRDTISTLTKERDEMTKERDWLAEERDGLKTENGYLRDDLHALTEKVDEMQVSLAEVQADADAKKLMRTAGDQSAYIDWLLNGRSLWQRIRNVK